MKIQDEVRKMDPPRYTVSDAADIVGRDQDTLRRWRRLGVLVPSDSRTFGKLKVGLYTDDDIKTMKHLAKTLKPGRRKSEV